MAGEIFISYRRTDSSGFVDDKAGNQLLSGLQRGPEGGWCPTASIPLPA